MSNIIEIKNLTKKYDHFQAVNDISFTLDKGSIVGFVGKNGAGKSTTIRCLMNMIFPTSGTCTIDGLDCITNAKQIRHIVGYMPSDSLFHNNILVKDLFKFCTSFSEIKMDKAIELSNYFELDIDKKIGELSLGNRKKVSIIQLLLKESTILILDEPTSGLDPLMQDKFFELLLKEKEKGTTIFLSSHNLNEIERYCDRTLIIKDGHIIDDIDMKKAIIKRPQIVTYTTKDGKDSSTEFNGDINELIKTLSALELSSLEIKTKSVEDEFIKYYKEDN